MHDSVDWYPPCSRSLSKNRMNSQIVEEHEAKFAKDFFTFMW